MSNHFFADFPFFDEGTVSAIYLFSSPFPFDRRTGFTKRAQDVPLVKAWYKEHCPPGQPVKVRVSYQKLLKNHVYNSLKSKRPTSRRKKYLLK